jgi:uncharacterized protein YprB with RNaseH-like and TPR domain
VTLKRSFIHIPGIGQKRERALWRRGVADWHAALSADLSWMGRRAGAVREEAKRSIERLAERDCAYFASKLPPRERWRLWPEFREDCCYLDIETDPYMPTIVGVHCRGRYRCFMRGRDLDEAPDFLASVKFLVTYCGTGFDLPVLRRCFGPDLLKSAAHLDTMHVLHSLGIRGGLKASEEALGIKRPPGIAGLSGDDAVRLWFEYRDGSTAALDALIGYNRADVMNLERILETVMPRLVRERLEEP